MSDVEKKIKNLQDQISKLVNRVSKLEKSSETPTQHSSLTEFPQILIKKIDKTSTKNLVLILLKIQPNQSIPEMTEKLLKIGWIKDTFFQKNFGSSLVNKGLIQKSGSDKSNKDRFSVTERGKLIADDLLSKLESLK